MSRKFDSQVFQTIFASVLPSMKKHKKYDVCIVLSTHTVHVEEDQKGCTEKLQVWNQIK